MLLQDAKAAMQSGEYKADLNLLYGESEVSAARYAAACDEFGKLFGKERDVYFFSAPGRTEVGGNHTDHQQGCVLCGSVNLDVIAVVSPNADNVIRIKSAGYEMDTVDLTDLDVHPEENGRAIGLIRGMAAAMGARGFLVAGFDAYTTSNVLKGSGLSSSAAFEVLVGTIISHLCNAGAVDAVSIAQMAQYSENVYFGKPCGLMDQMACSVGGFTGIDFVDPQQPVIEKVEFDLATQGYSLCIVDTGGNHADLTPDYAAIPAEMKAVAALFGQPVLRKVEEEAFLLSLATVRKECGDRAALRAYHFFRENARAVAEKDALKAGDFSGFLHLVRESGLSSFRFLQNVYSTHAPEEQGISLALAIAEQVLGDRGVARVHGGGFAGTIQAFVPDDLREQFLNEMEAVFGDGKCHVLRIRPVGGYALTAQAE